MCGVLPAHRGASVYRRHGAERDHSAPASCAGAAIGAKRASDPGDARTPGAGLPRQETRRPAAERATTGAVTRHDRGDDVGRGGGRPMVEPTSPTAGVGTRRDYAMKRPLSVGIDLERAHTFGEIMVVARIVVFMD